MSDVPALRIRTAHDAAENSDGDFVLYWMIAFRRLEWNFSLDRAVHWSRELRKPLVVLEPLRCGYPWASDRLHQFVIQGMADNALQAKKHAVLYYPYLEPRAGQGRGLLKALAKHACVVVTDDYPAFFYPHMLAAAATQVPVRFELVDSNGLLPLRAAPKVFLRAFDFRRWLEKNLPEHLAEFPQANPLARVNLPRLKTLPRAITKRWPAATAAQLKPTLAGLARFPIDHTVAPVDASGGQQAARKALRDFVRHKLDRYVDERNDPDTDVTSGLSPYLHFGHLSAHEIFAAVTEHVRWTPGKLHQGKPRGKPSWWGAGESADAFLDQLVTWRELGFNLCWQRDDYDQYESLPAWARKTLAKHARDKRDPVYSLADLEQARTYDPLWNAAQRQLVREGRIHNYLRMLWGKKILEWTRKPQEALDIMIELNNKYALDGRDPNSYSGIFWILGRYDRAWGPERPIFGTVRYMSSANTARKAAVTKYLERWAE